MARKRQTSIQLEPAQAAQVEALAEHWRIPRTQIVRWAVDMFLAKPVVPATPPATASK